MATMKIKCERCGRVVKVSGFVWKHRLRPPYAKKDEKGYYRGWNCDGCADEIERGIDREF